MLKLHTGSEAFVRPSMGSWITYGLGTENRNLPGFITICPTLAHGGVNNWSSAFLPAAYQGTPLGNASIPSDQARVRYIENSRIRATFSDCSSMRWPRRIGSIWPARDRTRRWRDGSIRSSWPSACKPSARNREHRR